MVLCLGTRLSDFATASRSAFENPDVRFISVNVNASDAQKLGGLAVVADVKLALQALGQALSETGWETSEAYRREAVEAMEVWRSRYRKDVLHKQGHVMSQATIIGSLNEEAQRATS